MCLLEAVQYIQEMSPQLKTDGFQKWLGETIDKLKSDSEAFHKSFS